MVLRIISVKLVANFFAIICCSITLLLSISNSVFATSIRHAEYVDYIDPSTNIHIQSGLFENYQGTKIFDKNNKLLWHMPILIYTGGNKPVLHISSDGKTLIILKQFGAFNDLLWDLLAVDAIAIVYEQGTLIQLITSDDLLADDPVIIAKNNAATSSDLSVSWYDEIRNLRKKIKAINHNWNDRTLNFELDTGAIKTFNF